MPEALLTLVRHEAQALCMPPQDSAWVVIRKAKKAAHQLPTSCPPVAHQFRERLTAFILTIAYINDKLVVVSQKPRRLYINDSLNYRSVGSSFMPLVLRTFRQ